MNPAVLKRFIVLMVVLIVALVVGTDILDDFIARAPGDYQTETGSLRLEDGRYDEALAHFNKALEEMPNHRGAVMGRAIVFSETKQYDTALAEFTYLIDYLEETLTEDDPTGRGVLAAAHANRGRIHDILGEYEKALEDYVAALNTDEETVSPGIVHKILYASNSVSSVRKRAQYIYEQLQLPEDQRVLSIPELDEKQRAYKP